MPPSSRQRRKLRLEMRALTSSIGMPRAWVSQSIAGQSSLSVQTARSGRQWSRKRRTQGSTSIGAYWWMQVSGSRSARNCAEVTVTVVTRQVSSGRVCCSRRKSSISDAASPTLAAWNQASCPSGRGRPASPIRSPSRAASSLPSACRRSSARRATPADRREAAR